MRSRGSAQGFSLMELMFAIAILGIVVSIAIPSLQQAALSSQLRATANNLLVATIAARSEAIKRNAIVQLCASTNGSSCGGTWEQGWIVSCATTDNVTCQAGAAGRLVLQVESSVASGLRVIAQGGASSLNFDPTGAAATAQVFKICRDRPVGDQERILTLTATGRGSITKTTTGSCP